MNAKTFEAFRQLVYEQSGIWLRDGKEALVSARVGKRMRALGFDNHRTYLRNVKEDESGEEVVHLLNAISTNVTSFFREPEHFDFLTERLHEWHDQGQRRLRLWCAACSSGEEPYSLAITMQETFGERNGVDAKILATDICTQVLEKSLEGRYPENKVEPVSKPLLKKYFERARDGDSVSYVVRPALRQRIVFRRLNLSQPPFPMRGPLDAIFCRNVMIYFNNETRKRLLDEMYRLLKPGGFLLVGHAESLTGMMSEFKTVRPSIYRK